MYSVERQPRADYLNLRNGFKVGNFYQNCCIHPKFVRSWIITCIILLAIKANSQSCDINSDGAVDYLDLSLIQSMNIGLFPCTANVDGSSTCNEISVEIVANAVVGGPCSPTARSVKLTWNPSISPNITFYNIYRGDGASDPKSRIGYVPGDTYYYIDVTVNSGVTYYYTVRSQDINGYESVDSEEVIATIP